MLIGACNPMLRLRPFFFPILSSGLAVLRGTYAELSIESKSIVDKSLCGTGAEVLFAPAAKL